MDIVIIGDGKVGHKLAMQLSGEKYNVTLIDKSERKLRNAVNEMPGVSWTKTLYVLSTIKNDVSVLPGEV